MKGLFFVFHTHDNVLLTLTYGFVYLLDSPHSPKTQGAVVITGAGKAFSAGGDYGFLRERGKDTPARNAHLMRQFYDLYLRVRKIPVPLIAAINGPAVGAGMCFAMAADMRIASTTARLGFTFVHIGLHPGMGSTFFLPKLVGPQIAARMLLTGELLKGNEAKEIGLVLDAVEESKVLSNAVELASKIASNAPIAVRTCVRTLRMNQDIGLEAALQREADAQAQCYGGTDFKEGVEAQVAKRAPVWTEYEDLGWKR